MDNPNKAKTIKPAWIMLILFVSLVISLGTTKFIDSNVSSQLLLSLEVMEENNPNAIPNHEVWIEKASINGEEELSNIYQQAIQSTGFEFRKATDYGYNNDVIVNVAGAGSVLQFSCASNKPVSFTFWKQGFSGMVHIQELQGDTVIYDNILDLFSSESEQRETYKLPLVNQPDTKDYIITVLITFAIISIVGIISIILINRRTNKLFSIRSICAAIIAFFCCSCLFPVVIALAKTLPSFEFCNSTAFRFVNDLFYSILGFIGLNVSNGAYALYCFIIYLIIFIILHICFLSLISSGKLYKNIHTTKRNEQSGQRSVGIDILKCFGALFVMGIHEYFYIGYYERPSQNLDMVVLTAIYVVMLSCVPIFILSTGYLMSKKKYSKDYFRNWFRYLVTYFIVFFMGQIAMKIKYGADLSITSILRSVSIYDNGYMAMFFGLYLLIPALNMIYSAADTMKKKMLLILGTVFLTIGQSILGNIFTRYWVCLAPIAYYFVGSFLREYEIKISPRKGVAILIVLVFLETVYCHFYSTDLINKEFFWNTYTNYENTYYIIPTFCITVIFSIMIINISKVSELWKKIVRKISSCTLEIFLLHSVLIAGYSWDFISNWMGSNLTPLRKEAIFPVVLVVEFVVTSMIAIPIHSISSKCFQSIFMQKGIEKKNDRNDVSKNPQDWKIY
ncbi:MAG: acyltransferase family protein [Clostridia bacterium]|nr:acyltransferase family protein [Clostridia bacterium]